MITTTMFTIAIGMTMAIPTNKMTGLDDVNDDDLDDKLGWCRRWRVKLNRDKSNCLFIERICPTDNENHCLHLFNDIIRPTNRAKFLGTELDDKLSFKHHF